MKKVFTKSWIRAAAIRAIKTFFQTLGSGVVVGAAMTDINWINLLSVSAVAFIASVCTSLAGLPEVKQEDLT